MDANAYTLLEVLGFNRQLFAPLFQRPYVWEKDKQWEPLWNDIKKIAENLVKGNDQTKPHFLGAIVLEQRHMPVGKPDARSIIDGQQRLTTLQVLLCAIRDICNNHEELALQKNIAENFIYNQNVVDDDDRYKIWPTNIDRENYKTLLNSNSYNTINDEIKRNSDLSDSRIVQAYIYFYNTINEWVLEDSENIKSRLDSILNAIQHKLRIVVIDIKKEDDAQVIFETLNARGTPLLPSDLVKNQLFHRAIDSGHSVEKLYEKYWKPFEEEDRFWREKVKQGRLNRPRIDQFLQHYLTLMLKTDVSARELFSCYQDFINRKSSYSTEWFFKSFRTYANYYERFQKNINRSNRESLFFWRIRALDTTTLFPFLMELYYEHDKNNFDKNEKIGIFIDIESYLIRRQICRLSTKNYNRIMLDLIQYLKKVKSYKREAIQEFLLGPEGDSVRWPDDEEFKKAWIESPMYNSLYRPRLRMILLALDEGLQTSKTEDYYLRSELTIEHFLPQNWETNWPLPFKLNESAEEKLERIRNRDHLKHTIGNLTFLTESLNPAVSNGSFKEKRKEILKHSAINLNRFLNDTKKWDENEIVKRSNKLFSVVKKTWPYPEKVI